MAYVMTDRDLLSRSEAERQAKAVIRDMVRHQVLEWSGRRGHADLVGFCEIVLSVLDDLREAESRLVALAEQAEALRDVAAKAQEWRRARERFLIYAARDASQTSEDEAERSRTLRREQDEAERVLLAALRDAQVSEGEGVMKQPPMRYVPKRIFMDEGGNFWVVGPDESPRLEAGVYYVREGRAMSWWVFFRSIPEFIWNVIRRGKGG